MDVSAQGQALAVKHPELHACLDPDRVRNQQHGASETFGRQDDFGDTGSGGRGESYVAAQHSTTTRARGINQLLDMVTANSRADSPVLLDLLGGDGLVSRIVALTGRTDGHLDSHLRRLALHDGPPRGCFRPTWLPS